MNTQINAYLAVGYACNQKCRCCPIANNTNKDVLIVPFDRIEKEADAMEQLGITDVTISGGEPTIHPDFLSIIDLFFKKNIFVHVLSNGERFSEQDFLESFLKTIKGNPISITTTFHSNHASEHEFQNQSCGSFNRSLEGLKALDAEGINIAIKHCITANNYSELPEFVSWVLNNFSANAEIQLWGIDICGVSNELAREMFVDYKKIGTYLEKAINLFEKSDCNCERVLNVNNLPLCMCDPYYWVYFTSPESDNYIEHLQNGKKMDAISGTASINCNGCRFRSYCPGVYFSNFALFGDNIVSQPISETRILSYTPIITTYEQQKIDLTYLSPYFQIELTPNGFSMWNTRLGEHVLLRIRTEQISSILFLLSSGVKDEKLIDTLNHIGVDGTKVLNEMILKGIVE